MDRDGSVDGGGFLKRGWTRACLDDDKNFLQKERD